MKSKLLGRKFLSPICFTVLVVVNRKAGLGLEDKDLWMIAGIFASFVLGESAIDAAHAFGGQAAHGNGIEKTGTGPASGGAAKQP
jgi:hypothetical protein